MAQRLIQSTVLHPDGEPWSGAAVDFTLLSDAYTLSPDQSFPAQTIRAVTDADGALVVTLAGGLDSTWRVTMPDGETFNILVGDGPTTTLETLRAAYTALVPVPPFDVQAFIESLVVTGGAQPSDADLTAIANLAPSNDDLIQRKAGAWTNRTLAQVLTDLGAQPLDADLTTIAGLTPTTDHFLVSAASAWASRTPAQARAALGSGLLYSNTSNSTAINSTAIETAFDRSYTVPANGLVVGDVLRLYAWGTNGTHSSGTVTITLRAKWGGVLIFNNPAFALSVSSSYGWAVEFSAIVRAIGASGSIVLAGNTQILNAGTGAIITDWASRGTTTINTTAGAAIEVYVTHGAANAANTATLSGLIVERLRV